MRNSFIVRLNAIISNFKSNGNTLAYQRELQVLDNDIKRMFFRGDNVDDLTEVSHFINQNLA